MIPYGKQDISIEDINSVLETLKSEFITQGPKVEKFEREFASYVGKKNAVSLTSATAALHLVILSLKLKEGEEVITPSLTWVSAANIIELQGGVPIFVDVQFDLLSG